MNKKYLPFILVVVLGVLFVAGVFVIKKINQPVSDQTIEDQSVPDLPDSQKPVAALIPTSDGHYLTLKVQQIKVAGASSMDYELLYKALNNGKQTTQGVPGTIQLQGASNIERKLLLGSESSGKFRYDQGVENGTLTLRFRNSSGKLLGKVTTDWHLQTGVTTVSSVDGSFKYTLLKATSGVWYITMKSFSQPSEGLALTYKDGWAVYASK